MLNFKGTLWNSTQNILPIHWKICLLYNIGILRPLTFKSSYAFLKCPLVGTSLASLLLFEFENGHRKCVHSGVPLWQWKQIWYIVESELFSVTKVHLCYQNELLSFKNVKSCWPGTTILIYYIIYASNAYKFWQYCPYGKNSQNWNSLFYSISQNYAHSPVSILLCFLGFGIVWLYHFIQGAFISIWLL